MASLIVTKDNVWEHLDKSTIKAVKALENNSGGVTSFIKLHKDGGTLPLLNASCHYHARYTDAYAGLWTTTYIDTGSMAYVYGTTLSKYAGEVFPNQDAMYSWWVEFLLSVINDKDSFYYPLKDHVKVVYNERGLPVAWVIAGTAPHICMTSFLVCTRKIREKLDPIYAHKLQQLYPDLSPMVILSLSLIVERFKSNDTFWTRGKDYKLTVTPMTSLKEFWANSGHTHCASFHPWLHNPKAVSYGYCTFDIKQGNNVQNTYESLGGSWTNTKAHHAFKSWLESYGKVENTVEPLFHTIDVNSKSTSIPLDDFVKRFVQFLEEVNK